MTLRVCLLLLVVSVVSFQNYAQQTITPQDTIKLISGGSFIGEIINTGRDSIQINTADFGIVRLARKDILQKRLISVETKDGNVFYGTVISEDEEVLLLDSDNLGQIQIPKSNIKKRTEMDSSQIRESGYWFANPQSTRYFWAPNAIGLKKGEGYYQNIYVFWNQVTYGLTDNFSVGGGIIPTFLFAGSPTPVFGTAKLSVPVVKDKFNLAGGAIAGTVLGGGGLFGIVFGSSTVGNPDNNVTLGLGYVFGGGEFSTSPLINVSGLFRLSPKGYLITENYYLPSDDVAAIGIGGRWIPKKVALDLLLIAPITETFIAFPLIGISIPF